MNQPLMTLQINYLGKTSSKLGMPRCLQYLPGTLPRSIHHTSLRSEHVYLGYNYIGTRGWNHPHCRVSIPGGIFLEGKMLRWSKWLFIQSRIHENGSGSDTARGPLGVGCYLFQMWVRDIQMFTPGACFVELGIHAGGWIGKYDI